MFAHKKRLQYTVRVSESNPGLANLMLEQFGGPQGELAAACRYFTQYLGEDDPGRKDMLIDIATEELSHLEVIGSIVAMLNKGAKGRLAEAMETEADLYRTISGSGNDSHVTQVLYGGGPPLTNSGGVPWSAAYIDTIGDPSADLRSNIAAEARAKIVYEQLINLTDDPGVKEALGFLMTREIAHQQSFEKALYSIQPNFPPGKLPGYKEFANVYFNMSNGNGTDDVRGPWNKEPTFEYRKAELAVDGGSGMPEVSMSSDEELASKQLSARTHSDLASDPPTGAELGMGQMPLGSDMQRMDTGRAASAMGASSTGTGTSDSRGTGSSKTTTEQNTGSQGTSSGTPRAGL
jgi:Mn-containing catalase